MLKIGLASDHAGFELKKHLENYLSSEGISTTDYGCFSEQSCDYPDFAHALANGLEKGECTLGIAICGTGQGMSITLNKHQGIRAALCWSPEIAELARRHNNANILVMPGRFLQKPEAEKITKTFLETSFDGGRHIARVNKIPLSEN